jgi:Carboxypeptidase regulatory-like domain
MAMTTHRGLVRKMWLGLSALLCCFTSIARSQGASIVPTSDKGPIVSPGTSVSADKQLPDQPLGSISGIIVDQTGTAISDATVRLTRQDESLTQEMSSDEDGRFSFPNISRGPFELTFTSPGFATRTLSGSLRSGERYVMPQIALTLAPANTEVRVVPERTEMAEDQIKDEEKQRVLGVIPNFYVSYLTHAVPLTPKQKFELAWKTTTDPISFGINGVIAGLQQAQNDFSGYEQGAQGYAKRYGASYGDFVAGTFIGSAILPSLLKQDPRYFYKGSGSKRSRALYAIASSVMCKGDDGHWQANYSSILGGLAAGGISNLYYPAKDRNGASLTFENALIGIGASAGANLLQEFLIRKLTPNDPNRGQTKPKNIASKLSNALVYDGD